VEYLAWLKEMHLGARSEASWSQDEARKRGKIGGAHGAAEGAGGAALGVFSN
jgi:hypothetical protein